MYSAELHELSLPAFQVGGLALTMQLNMRLHMASMAQALKVLNVKHEKFHLAYIRHGFHRGDVVNLYGWSSAYLTIEVFP